MKKLLRFGSLLMLLLTSFAFAQTSDSTLNQFLSSNQYTQLKKTFALNDTNFDLKTYDKQVLENGNVEYFKVQVNSDSKVNFATFYKVNGTQDFMVVYEKNNLDSSNTSGYFEHYDENGNFYADFIVTKAKGNLYSFKINDVDSSVRLGISGSLTQRGGPCLTKTYNYIKSTCEADLT